ncbi:MAG: single-stranded DNA-binding protein [Atopobiaceae bacterium]|nr:single-stranded DNA-binding protein [Atopobiaceae bacterium]
MSINRVNISGNLTRDPEMRATQSGTSILTFGVAVNDRRRNPQTGEWEDYPNYIDCVVFGNRAEPLHRFLSKGMKVAVEGKLRWSQWERDGQKRSKIEVIVDEVEFLSPRQGGQQGQAPQGAYQPRQQMAAPAPTYAAPQPTSYSPQPVVQTPPPTDVYDEDIPF